MVVDLEAFGTIHRVIEIQVNEIITQRFARPIGIVVATEAAHEAGELARGLEVTLETHIVAKLGRELRGIDDRRADRLVRGVEIRRQPDVLSAGSVTTLTPHAFGQRRWKHMGLTVTIAPQRDVGIGVVTEHAGARDPARNAVVICVVVSRRHAPRLLLRVPHHGQLKQFANFGLIEIAARVRA